jgi:ketosteroid isomerase-like protein
MEIVSATAYRHGDLALTHTHWRVAVPDGEPMEGMTAEIVRRQPDGTWKYAVDNPWGTAVLSAP